MKNVKIDNLKSVDLKIVCNISINENTIDYLSITNNTVLKSIKIDNINKKFDLKIFKYLILL